MIQCYVRGHVVNPDHGMIHGPSDEVLFWFYSKDCCHYSKFKFHNPEDPEIVEEIYNKWLREHETKCDDPCIITSWHYEYASCSVPDPQDSIHA